MRWYGILYPLYTTSVPSQDEIAHVHMSTHPEDVVCGMHNSLTGLHGGAANHYNVYKGPSIWDETS